MKSPKPPDYLEPVRSLPGHDKSRRVHHSLDKPWWPEEFGSSADLSGSRAGSHFAYFANALRLLVKRGEEVATYNTRGLEVSSVSWDDSDDVVLETGQGKILLGALRRI